MILTESDLHAYNRSELPDDAVKRLEDDPLAVQDAARLRAISGALRDEAPIPVLGRAETLERLRAKSRSGIGVPGWVWAAGVACVFGLVLISVPPEKEAEFALRQASYLKGNSATVPSSSDMAFSEPEARVGSAAAAASPAMPAREMQERDFARSERPESQRKQAAGGVDVARTASLDLRVEDTARAKVAAEAATKRLGGFVADAALTRPNDRPTATLTLRVPSARLDALIAEVRALGGLAAESSASEDVTAKRVDYEARLTTMAAEERQLRELLSQARNVNEVLRVRERLSEVRAEIESLTATLKTLNGRVQLATLNVTLTQRPKPGAPALQDGWPRDSVGGAVNTLRSLGRRATTAAIYIGVFSPLWLPVLVFAYLRSRRR